MVSTSSCRVTARYLPLLGDAAQAITRCERALFLERDEVGDVRGEAFALDALGSAHHRLGNNEEALTFHAQALSLFQDFGDRYGQIKSLGNLGDTLQTAGRTQDARTAWQRALDMTIEIGDADAGHIYPEQILARLRRLEDQE